MRPLGGRRARAALPLALLLVCVACSGSSNSITRAPTAARTAPPAQTAVIRVATPTPGPGATARPSEVTRIVNDVKLSAADLPSGSKLDQFQLYQTNQDAAVGFENPDDVIKRMETTGRLGGYAQSYAVPDGSSGAGGSIDIWRDAAGAKQYFDQYPKPANVSKVTQVDLPHQLGDQSLALRIEQNGQVTYSISWRRGRIILGVGETFPPGRDSLDKTVTIADALDKKAKGEPQ